MNINHKYKVLYKVGDVYITNLGMAELQQLRDPFEDGNYTESNETSALNNANTTEIVVIVPDDDGYVKYNYRAITIVCIFLHALAILFCLVSFIFVIYYRTHPIISKAQPRTYDV